MQKVVSISAVFSSPVFEAHFPNSGWLSSLCKKQKRQKLTRINHVVCERRMELSRTSGVDNLTSKYSARGFPFKLADRAYFLRLHWTAKSHASFDCYFTHFAAHSIDRFQDYPIHFQSADFCSIYTHVRWGFWSQQNYHSERAEVAKRLGD